MKIIEKYLVDKKGLEKIEKKSVTQFAIQGLVAFSVSESKRIVTISFPLFRDETTGSRSTAKENLQRDKFLEIIEGDDRINLMQNTPVGKFESEQEAVDFIKYNQIVKLAKEYTEFAEVNSDYTVSEISLEGAKLRYRSNIPTEEEIMRDVFLHREYERKGLELTESDVVLDLGGNIGAFTCGICKRVKKVITFEPEDKNFEFLSANVKLNNVKNVQLFKKAVVGNTDKTRDFYLGKVPYYYSFLVKNKRKRVVVECININEVMKLYKLTKMKVDIEGSEREVLMACKDFGRVDQLIFEYNFDMNHDLQEDFKYFNALSKHLKKHGFDTSALDNYSRSKSWAEVFLCNRVVS